MTPLDLAMLRERRHRLLAQARGRVLELGGSGGANLDHYPAGAVDEVVVVGAGTSSRSRVERAAARSSLDVRVARSARSMGEFDTIVAVFALSGRPDLEAELRSLVPLVKPDGQLLFMDHSPRRPPGVTTELSRPFWRFMTDGFVPGRDLPETLRRSGFTVLTLERFGLRTLTLPLRTCVAGVARRQRPGGGRRPKLRPS